MITPTVSVVIPAYKAERTIGRALESLRVQTRTPDEVLVVDDGSPDDPAAIVARYEFARLIRQENGGAASARNCGIDQARGNLIAFLDADDYWEPGKLEAQLAVFRAYPEVGLVASRYFRESPGSARLGPGPAVEGLTDCVVRATGAEAFALAARVWTTTVLVRREVLGDRRFVPGLEPAEDRDLWVRLVTSTSTYMMSEPTATYVEWAGSLSRSSIDRDCTNMLRVVHRYSELLGAEGVRSWEAKTYRRWAAGHLSRARPRAAISPAIARLKRQPLSVQGWWILGKSTVLACAASPRGRASAEAAVPS